MSNRLVFQWKVLLYLTLVVVLAVALSADADANDALVILQSKNFAKTKQVIADLESVGTRVLHVFPPRTLICSVPTSQERQIRAHKDVAALHRTAVQLPDQASPMADIRTGATVWNSFVDPEPETDAPEGSPLIGDAFLPPTEETQQFSIDSISIAAAPTTYQTSEFLVGSVVVGIILPESAGTAENWTTAREDQVISEITQGCNWWVTMGGAKAHLTFYYDIHRSVPTQHEPIQLSSSNDSLWISETLTAIGYPGTSATTQCRNYINAIRTSYGTNWSYAIFVVDSLNDTDGKFTNGYFGYAYLGGPRVVMTWDNDGWGISRMDTVTSHETGHIFLAGDEYCDPGYACCSFGNYGYLNVYNGNCESGNPSSVSCMMRRNSSVLCSYTLGQIGWRDTDGDNIYDPEDTTVGANLSTSSTGPTFNFTGTAYDIPCDSPTRSECSLNKITSVHYRLNGGPWQPVTPADTFDSWSENFSLSTGPLSEGIHTLEVKPTNSVGNSTIITREIAYDTTQPVAPTVVTDDGAFTSYPYGLNASWNAGSDPQSGILEYQVAVGTSPTDPIGGYTVYWRSTGTAQSVSLTGLNLVSGSTYYFYVKAKNKAGLWSASAVSDGIKVQPANITIAAAKMLPDNHLVRLERKVVSAKLFSNLFHIQEEDRSAGTWVESTVSVVPGDRVTFNGTLATSYGERKIINVNSLANYGTGEKPKPLGMRNIDIGGTPLSAYTPGVVEPHGPHNLGLLVRTFGKVTLLASDGFYISDGSMKNLYETAVVSTASVSVGDYVVVTGISSVSMSSPDIAHRSIRCRDVNDVIKVY